MRIRSRHMGVAIGAALAIHVAAAIAMVLEPEVTGAAATGMTGIEVSLGPAGSAPGSVAAAVGEVERADTVGPAAAPVAEAETAEPDRAPVEEMPPESAQAAGAPPPPPVDAPAETVQVVDEVVAIVRAERVETVPPEPAQIEPLTRAEPVEVMPEPGTVAKVEPDVPSTEAPPLPISRPQPPEALTSAAPVTVPQAKAQPMARQPASAEAPVADTAQAAAPVASVDAGRGGVGRSPPSGSAASSSGGGRPGVSVDYVSILQAWLEDHKEYPHRARSRRQQGVVWLHFVMDRNGRVLEHRIDRSSGYDLLDREVEAMIARAQPLPAMPAEMTQARLELVVPVQFVLR